MNKFNKIINEHILCSLSDKEIIREAIQAEYDAVNLYEQMSNTTKNKKLKNLLLDVASEEKIHIGEFTAFLEKIDKEHADKVKKGYEEVN